MIDPTYLPHRGQDFGDPNAESTTQGLAFGRDPSTARDLTVNPTEGPFLVVGNAGSGTTQALRQITLASYAAHMTVHLIGSRTEHEFASLTHATETIATTPLQVGLLLEELATGITETPTAKDLPAPHTLLIFDNDFPLLERAGLSAIANLKNIVKNGHTVGVLTAVGTHRAAALGLADTELSDFPHVLMLGKVSDIVQHLIIGEIGPTDPRPGCGIYSSRDGIQDAQVFSTAPVLTPRGA